MQPDTMYIAHHPQMERIIRLQRFSEIPIQAVGLQMDQRTIIRLLHIILHQHRIKADINLSHQLHARLQQFTGEKQIVQIALQ